MSNSRPFSGVTLEILNRMKALGRAERHRLRPPKAPLSTATRQTPFGERVIEFVHDPAKVELTLTLVKKPWLLPAESVDSSRVAPRRIGQKMTASASRARISTIGWTTWKPQGGDFERERSGSQ